MCVCKGYRQWYHLYLALNLLFCSLIVVDIDSVLFSAWPTSCRVCSVLPTPNPLVRHRAVVAVTFAGEYEDGSPGVYTMSFNRSQTRSAPLESDQTRTRMDAFYALLRSSIYRVWFCFSEPENMKKGDRRTFLVHDQPAVRHTRCRCSMHSAEVFQFVVGLVSPGRLSGCEFCAPPSLQRRNGCRAER